MPAATVIAKRLTGTAGLVTVQRVRYWRAQAVRDLQVEIVLGHQHPTATESAEERIAICDLALKQLGAR